jgi:ribosomal protein L20A (L18A)
VAVYKISVLKYKIVQFDYEVEAGSGEAATELVYWGLAEEKKVKDLEFLDKIKVKSIREKHREEN